MCFNSLTTECTVAVFPVPGTPEMSVEDDQFITSSLTTERGHMNSQMHPPLPSSSNSSTTRITRPYSPSTLHQGRTHQPLWEEVLAWLVDAHGTKCTV